MEVRSARNPEYISEHKLRAAALSSLSVGRNSAGGELPRNKYCYLQSISNDTAIGTCNNFQRRQRPRRVTGPPKHLKRISEVRNDLRIVIDHKDFRTSHARMLRPEYTRLPSNNLFGVERIAVSTGCILALPASPFCRRPPHCGAPISFFGSG